MRQNLTGYVTVRQFTGKAQVVVPASHGERRAHVARATVTVATWQAWMALAAERDGQRQRR